MLWVMFPLGNHICLDNVVGVLGALLTSSIFWGHIWGSLVVSYRVLVEALPYFSRGIFHML